MQIPTPDYFYHWVKPGNKVPRNLLGGTTLPPHNRAIFNAFLRNEQQSVLYLWSHPVGGMAVAQSEQYAFEEHGIKSKLLVLKPKENATYGAFISDNRVTWVTEETPKAPETDFVLHIRIERGKIAWQEWILQNPQAVLWSSTRQKVIEPIVRPIVESFDAKTAPRQFFHNPEDR